MKALRIITPEKLKRLEEEYIVAALALTIDNISGDLLPSLKDRLRRLLLVGWVILIIFKILFYTLFAKRGEKK